ncbi:PREDICTED: uncharacterized protein LOC108609029 [Drosophila arizonae]|uniref:Uncharacterized protein LOC108609029 n=1 Tax=Drosophila arizonae TaxID=7263 RepID=A0ABM1NMK5_DROAR|nr:PREDICTED: uncharacterized protein LOC108609029 [Drosophila arizonae]
MSTRLCAYKDCHNFYHRQDSSGCSEVTLFAFPKDPKRAEQWRILGQVHPKIGPMQLYMCSKHFDAKYLSLTRNRRILLGEALPFPYEDPNKTDTKEMAATSSTEQQSYYINSTGNKIQLAEDNPKDISSSSQQSFYINMDDDDLSIDKVIMVESTTTQVVDPQADMFEKIEVNIIPSTQKRPRLTTPREEEDNEKAPLPTDEELIDTSEVSIFKFKGEQYVQMSREYYLQEKRQLMEQLNSYKSTLASIRKQLMSLKEL